MSLYKFNFAYAKFSASIANELWINLVQSRKEFFEPIAIISNEKQNTPILSQLLWFERKCEDSFPIQGKQAHYDSIAIISNKTCTVRAICNYFKWYANILSLLQWLWNKMQLIWAPIQREIHIFLSQLWLFQVRWEYFEPMATSLSDMHMFFSRLQLF